MHTKHEMNIILFDDDVPCAWLVEDGSDGKVESYNPTYSDK